MKKLQQWIEINYNYGSSTVVEKGESRDHTKEIKVEFNITDELIDMFEKMKPMYKDHGDLITIFRGYGYKIILEIEDNKPLIFSICGVPSYEWEEHNQMLEAVAADASDEKDYNQLINFLYDGEFYKYNEIKPRYYYYSSKKVFFFAAIDELYNKKPNIKIISVKDFIILREVMKQVRVYK